MEYLLNFAQDDEDIIMYHVLKDMNPIKWIDVGANDPVNASVTKFFSMMGGNGINIEPQRSFYKKLVADRPNDINIWGGISNKKGSMILYGREGSQVASFCNKDGYNKGAQVRQVPVFTLEEICDRYIKESEIIHFLKIDVEGWEKQCIEGMNFDKYRPMILCIESPEEVDEIEWEKLLSNASYKFVMQDHVNRYYVAEENSNLASRFLSREELTGEYDITQYSSRKINQRFDRIMRQIKSMKVLVPLRYMYNYQKNLNTRSRFDM